LEQGEGKQLSSHVSAADTEAVTWLQLRIHARMEIPKLSGGKTSSRPVAARGSEARMESA
jgi:hypothetical protein